MFTGIIEETGIIKKIARTAGGAVISVECNIVTEGLKIGDSIAVNGACQTAVSFDKNSFTFDAAKETFDVTNFSDFNVGTVVNLERAMPANGRFNGHVVSGHVDGTGIFENKVNQGIADVYTFEAPENVSKYIVYKGSICINGISLTIANIEGNIFTVSVIPETIRSTNLRFLKNGDRVNLESDIFAKYIEKFLTKTDNKTDNITLNYLEEHGFLD